MKFIDLKLCLLIAFALHFFVTNAQMGAGGMARQGVGGGGQTGRMYGRVIDSATKKGLTGSVVELVSSKFDMATKSRKDTTLNARLTESNGDFALENIPVMGDYTLRITTIGYRPIEQKVSFLTPQMQKDIQAAFMEARQKAKDSSSPRPPSNPMEIIRKALGGDLSQLMQLTDKDLGNFSMAPNADLLPGVTVVGSKPLMQLGIDRKIFNVDKSLAASGSSAVELMRQIPLVNVDIDGNVSVRNAAPTLFVDGRPTTLTLDQIPADDIQSVELITNPSAKYDASGGMAAILNIVLKKNKRTGYNGNLRAGIDSRAKPNVGGDINLRQGKVNMFVSGQYGARRSLGWTDIETNYKAVGQSPATFIGQDVYSESNGNFRFLRAGIDWFISNRSTLTLAGNLMRGSFKSEEDNLIRYDSMYSPIETSFRSRNTTSDRLFKNRGGTLSFKQLFTKPGTELTADLNYGAGGGDGNSFIRNSILENGNPLEKPFLQNNYSESKTQFLIAQTDFTKRISNNWKMEMGLRAQDRKFNSLNNNSIYNYNSENFILLPASSPSYDFVDRVYAGYTSFSGKLTKDGKLGFNAGLRAESSSYQGEMTKTGEKFEVEFPISLFPSSFLSYQLTEKSDLQFNYTRRINRPNFFQLMPYINYDDPLNLSVGNASLQPEFTNSFEANYSQQFSNKHTLLLSTYFKRTNGLLTRYQYKGLNQITLDSAIFNTWVNANFANSAGFEITSTNKITPKFDATTNFNLYNSKINGENLEAALTQSQWSFFAKTTLTQKIGKNNQWTIQANGDYQSKTVIPVSGGGGGRGGGMMFGGGNQSAGTNGYVKPNYGVDVSLRRELFKNKSGAGYRGSLTLSMNDILRSKVYGAVTGSSFFDQTILRRRDPQVLRLQFNYRFGKLDTSLFKRKNLKGEMEGINEGNSMQ